MNRHQLAIAIREAAHLEGQFRLRSGQRASEYFDKYQFESQPDLLAAVAEELVVLIPGQTEILAGLELGGVPIATALSLRMRLPMVLVRKAPKPYGTERLAEGVAIRGRRLLVVEDVVTTGGQIVASVSALRAEGAIIDNALCVIDREAGGAERLSEHGVHLTALFTRSELTERAASAITE
jgi:orotate phosphoribosyltransferase